MECVIFRRYYTQQQMLGADIAVVALPRILLRFNDGQSGSEAKFLEHAVIIAVATDNRSGLPVVYFAAAVSLESTVLRTVSAFSRHPATCSLARV